VCFISWNNRLVLYRICWFVILFTHWSYGRKH